MMASAQKLRLSSVVVTYMVSVYANVRGGAAVYLLRADLAALHVLQPFAVEVSALSLASHCQSNRVFRMLVSGPRECLCINHHGFLCCRPARAGEGRIASIYASARVCAR